MWSCIYDDAVHLTPKTQHSMRHVMFADSSACDTGSNMLTHAVIAPFQ